MKTFSLRLFTALALVVALLFTGSSLLTTGSAQTRRQPARKPLTGTALFVVSSNSEPGETPEYGMDALVILNRGKYIDPVGEADSSAMKPFAEKYFKAGNKYRVLFGGGEVGSAIVKSYGEGCNTIHSTISVESSAKIGGHIKGLATNSETLGKKASSRRALTQAERAGVMTLAKNIYRQHKTSNALMRSLQVNNLTATDLDGDGKFEIVGDFQIAADSTSTEGPRRDLFLIATPSGAGYKAELAEFQSYRMNSGFGRGVGFVDQLDMDGDGQAEVVTVDQGFDGYGYSIYKKQGGRWRMVYSVMGDAC
ncbi:MAG: hypothetical protein QOJ02_4077 [Acidobacteriota bacterium]|jgi:hypothetical protein|nr:hypothetical protein [Acidobacteriota bacterium]